MNPRPSTHWHLRTGRTTCHTRIGRLIFGDGHRGRRRSGLEWSSIFGTSMSSDECSTPGSSFWSSGPIATSQHCTTARVLAGSGDIACGLHYRTHGQWVVEDISQENQEECRQNGALRKLKGVCLLLELWMLSWETVFVVLFFVLCRHFVLALIFSMLTCLTSLRWCSSSCWLSLHAPSCKSYTNLIGTITGPTHTSYQLVANWATVWRSNMTTGDDRTAEKKFWRKAKKESFRFNCCVI